MATIERLDSGGASARPSDAASAVHAPRRALRVVHLLKHTWRANGSVHVAVDLACAQADAGLDVWVASVEGSYDDVLAAHGVRVVALPALGGALGTARHARAIASLVRHVDPDVVHAHMMSSAVLAAPVVALSGATLVTTVHNSFDKHSWMMRTGRTVVAVSQAERDLLVSRGFRPDRVRVVLNGSGDSAREPYCEDQVGTVPRPCVMTLSGLHERKAIDDVIRAFEVLAPECPEWHLNIVGWGPAHDELAQQIAQADLGDRVHLLGPSYAPWHPLAKADIVVSASLAEPFGLSLSEARAAGCAVVATRVGGMPEVLEHGRAGLLVEPRDPQALAAALRPLMTDREELERWRARALDGSERFTAARMARDYLSVYLDAIAARRVRRLVQDDQFARAGGPSTDATVVSPDRTHKAM
ncbi:glycosyltransferase family 4 protein [Demequina sp.]|uniref:glycosyltransferase family 4 protein n=1 Tax=Demequina sp. TaxID=2050685 RepID=UPI003A83E35F